MKSCLKILLLLTFVFSAFKTEALVNSSTLRGQMSRMDRLCWEIGRTARYPSVCKKPTRVSYKGVICWGCPEASRCTPACRGGKVCVNQKCVCPPNQVLYDCHGRCLSPATPCTK